MFAVDDYKALRAELHKNRQLKASGYSHFLAAAPQETRQVSDLRSSCSVVSTSPSFRKTLIFERDITLQTNGESKRWSLQVPAKNMNPEMVDMMLELHDLKSYFGNKPEGVDKQENIPREARIPPTLVLSNSTLAIPISLDSSPSLVTDVPLAVRRGKKIPQELSFRDEKNDIPYPGMPTAFLGSPTNYSPKFEHVNTAKEPSMELGDMMASLRYRCASLGCRTSSNIQPPEDAETYPTKVSMASFSEDQDDDEWAFADTLMDVYGSKSSSDDTLKSITMLISNANPELGSPSGSKKDASILTVDATGPKLILHPTRAPLPRPSAQNFLDPVTPPPTSPLPSCPVPSPTKQVRGILKSTKSVRFASLPDEDDNKPPIIPPRIPTLSSVVRQSPSPLRRSFERDCQEARPDTPTFFAPDKTASSRATVRKNSALILATKSPTTRRASESSALRSIVRRPSIVTPPKTTPTSQSRPSASSLGRHSMGAGTGKENRARSSSTPMHPSRFVLDENTLKRAKKVNARDSGSQKSRMPVAVRNIFTRFK
jgi:hypothetical protein